MRQVKKYMPYMFEKTDATLPKVAQDFYKAVTLMAAAEDRDASGRLTRGIIARAVIHFAHSRKYARIVRDLRGWFTYMYAQDHATFGKLFVDAALAFVVGQTPARISYLSIAELTDVFGMSAEATWHILKERKQVLLQGRLILVDVTDQFVTLTELERVTEGGAF